MDGKKGEFRHTMSTNHFFQTPLVEVSRVFQATIEQLWTAWTQEDLLKQWWGPEGFVCNDARADFTLNGKYLLSMKDTQTGDEQWCAGSYQEIIPNQAIVMNETFSNQFGIAVTPEQAGMKEWKGDYHGMIRIEFHPLIDDKTRMIIKHDGIPENMHASCITGWNSSINKLQKLVEIS